MPSLYSAPDRECITKVYKTDSQSLKHKVHTCVLSLLHELLLVDCSMLSLLLTQVVLLRYADGWVWCSEVTRSQAVARIADRTAKNCRGHVT